MKLIIILLLHIISFLNFTICDIDHDERGYHPEMDTNTISHAKFVSTEYKEEEDSEYWNSLAQNILHEKLQQTFNTNKAKNIIFFLGDGMSLETVVATRIMVGGESNLLSFEKFPHFGLSKTYCVNKQVADSACTATAYLSGVKNNYGTIGVNAQVTRGNCEQGLDKSTHTKSIASWAQDAGKATGFVTTTRVTHASPAGLYAHTANRDWENDLEVKNAGCSSEKVDDIAEQLIMSDVGKKFKVIMGGGRREFLPNTKVDEEGEPGRRLDNKNLIETWKNTRSTNGKANYVWNKKDLQNLNVKQTDYLLGLFENDHCMYQADIMKNNLNDVEPSLSEMVEVAVNMLSKYEKGYFLFVEGGRIDMAHHDTKARKALTETEELAKAVQIARNMTNESDTLIIVTSDHSHTMTFNGYPPRGSDILGLAGVSSEDKLPYLTLSYANGPGNKGTYNENGDRVNLTNVDISDLDFEYSATVLLDSETHGGDDVGVYASGPWSHSFVGNYEQNVIPFLLAKAGEIGEYYVTVQQSRSSITQASFVLITILILQNILRQL